MSDYYVDPAAAGANDGSSWTDAYTSPQSAENVVIAGDNVHCRGTTNVMISLVTAGTADAYITYIGYNSSGIDDGTFFTFDANSTNAYGIEANNINYRHWKNIQCINATSDGVGGANTPDLWFYENCDFSNNTSYGVFSQRGGRNLQAVNCSFSNNGSYGSYNGLGSYHNCLFSGNGNYGLLLTNAFTCSNSLFYNNTNGGASINAQGASIINCILDDNAIGVYAGQTTNGVINCRITNATTGVSCPTGKSVIISNSYFYDNTADYTGPGTIVLDKYTRVTADNSADGYTSQATRDYTLTPGNDGVGVAVNIGDYSESGMMYPTQGLPPQYAVASTPTFAGITKFEALTNGIFKVSWAAGSGTITGYNIYLRTATNPFSAAYLCFRANSDETFAFIFVDPNTNNFLLANTQYFCGVKAENSGSEDSNTVEISEYCSGSEAIQRVHNTTVIPKP